MVRIISTRAGNGALLCFRIAGLPQRRLLLVRT